MTKITKLLGGLALCLGSGLAMGQDVSTSVKSEETPTLKRNSFELRPLDILMSSIPGIAAAGASYEAYLGSGFAAVVDGAYYDVNLSGRQTDIAEEESDNPVVDEGYGYSAGAGLRIYEDAIGDSAYATALLTYREMHADWTYEDETLASAQYVAIPQITVGYRWVWPKGLLLRAGIGAGLPSVASQSVSSSAAVVAPVAATAGEDKLEDVLDQKVMVTGDLGIGWMF